MKILFNGIPSSGKSTFAQRLHLALEHLGFQTILLDDEVIKRLDAKQIKTISDYIDSPITIIASCNPDIEADVKFWVDTPINECKKRNHERLERENAPMHEDYSFWEGYYSPGKKITKWEEVCLELKNKNLNF